MEIKIISVNNELLGVQRTELREFHDYRERYPYLGNAVEGETIYAKLVYQGWYPGNQWAEIMDTALNTDRKTRRVYLDSDD